MVETMEPVSMRHMTSIPLNLTVSVGQSPTNLSPLEYAKEWEEDNSEEAGQEEDKEEAIRGSIECVSAGGPEPEREFSFPVGI